VTANPTANDPVNQSIAKAVALMRESPELGDTNIYSTLVADGMDRFLAARLVEFLPMAYCRLILANEGVRFSENFRRRLENGAFSEERPLSSEPLWKACSEFAIAEAKNGVGAKELLAVAGRSSELDAANKLLNRGAKLGDIKLVSVVLIWTEGGP
jgi:hypothetical protein